MSRSKAVLAKAEPSPPPSGQSPGENLARRDAQRLAAELRDYYTAYAV
jgi:hypothetical protein